MKAMACRSLYGACLILLACSIFSTLPLLVVLPLANYLHPSLVDGLISFVEDPSAAASAIATERTSTAAAQAEQAAFTVGTVFRHKHRKYQGVIFQMDEKFAGTNLQYSLKDDPHSTTHGQSQRFYHVLVDTRYIRGGIQAYVAHENIQRLYPGTSSMEHPRLDQHFSGYDSDESIYTPRQVASDEGEQSSTPSHEVGGPVQEDL